MSLLESVYGITPPTSADLAGSLLFPLGTPLTKFFNLDFDFFSEPDNRNINILWNFGDPFCDPNDNEILSHSILDTFSHEYLYAGTYEVTCIATIRGSVFHITNFFSVLPDNQGAKVIASKTTGTYVVYNFLNYEFPITLSCYDSKAKIYYAVGASATNYQIYTEPIVLTSSDTIKFYAVLFNGTTTDLYIETYTLTPTDVTLTISPYNTIQAGPFNVSIIPSITLDPSMFRILYQTTQEQYDHVYTAPFIVSENTTVTAIGQTLIDGVWTTFYTTNKAYVI